MGFKVSLFVDQIPGRWCEGPPELAVIEPVPASGLDGQPRQHHYQLVLDQLEDILIEVEVYHVGLVLVREEVVELPVNSLGHLRQSLKNTSPRDGGLVSLHLLDTLEFVDDVVGDALDFLVQEHYFVLEFLLQLGDLVYVLLFLFLDHLGHASVVLLEPVYEGRKVPLVPDDILLQLLADGQALGQTALQLVLKGSDVLTDHVHGLADGHHAVLSMSILLVHAVSAQGLAVDFAVQGQDGVMVQASLGCLRVVQGLHALDGGLDVLLEVLLDEQDLGDFRRVEGRLKCAHGGGRGRSAAGRRFPHHQHNNYGPFQLYITSQIPNQPLPSRPGTQQPFFYHQNPYFTIIINSQMSHSCLPQSHCLQRTRSLRQPNPLPYFRRFQQNLDVLKQQVQTFNNWENYASAANIVGEKSTHSRRLKRMTEPKYHGTVLRLLVEKERHGDPRQRTDREQRKVSESLVSRQTITDKSQASTGLLQEITGNSNLCLISRTEKVKKGEVRFNVRRKQKILQNQWSKLENYRSQNRIYNAAEALPISKKERLIFSKILQNRKQSSQTPELGENEASFESGLEFLKLN